MGKIRFFFSEAFGSLRRNYFMTLAALVTVFLSMFVLGVVMVFAYNINAVLKDVEQKVEITVFLHTEPEPTPEQVQTLQTEIVGWPEVKESVVISPEEGLKRLRADMGEDADILQQLPDNPIPTTFEISLKDPRQAETVAGRFEGKEIVEDVSFGKELAERIFSAASVLRNVMIVFLVLLGAVSILLISNTIRLSIYARRREVEIMKLVGATNWFIRWPFVIEGLFVGLTGAVAALAVVLIGSDFVLDRIHQNLRFLMLSFDAVSPTMLALVLIGVGAFIGASGSGLGLRRFLNV